MLKLSCVLVVWYVCLSLSQNLNISSTRYNLETLESNATNNQSNTGEAANSSLILPTRETEPTSTETITTPPMADVHLCTINYGTCVNDHSTECSEEKAAIHGICEDDKRICCVDNQQTQHSWLGEDVECTVGFGICQLETISCDGEFSQGRCAGPTQRKCCSPNAKTKQSWLANDTACHKKMGACHMNKVKCDGNFEELTCGGPATRQCCVPSQTLVTKWQKHDAPCWEKWGSCQAKVDICVGGKYETSLCGGPQERQCCVPGEAEIKKWEAAEADCIRQFGTCQHTNQECGNGTVDINLCQGPSHRGCCRPNDSVRESWIANDETCIEAAGNCQHIEVDDCNGEYTKFNTCGGPKERQCCVVHKENKQLPKNTAPDSTNPSNSTTRIVLLVTAGALLFIILLTVIIVISRRRFCRPYKRVRDDTWFEKNGYDETVKLTACEEKGAYA